MKSKPTNSRVMGSIHREQAYSELISEIAAQVQFTGMQLGVQTPTESIQVDTGQWKRKARRGEKEKRPPSS